ncbi:MULTISPECIES: cytochrome c biogenesis protein CcsA [Segatella]|jgi:ABC-type transport system involved in cytochrome c biogenesis permease subunit|uniref:Cytochrome C biogenesis protein n=1 Tax=Segatella copri TaxID=165179 RepID=A0AA93BEM9_9BACT|nr:cytochrome c biogenesis protein CcsA [Segatella copri]MCF0067977.1 cytochrome c biogenesis protein CcsA [Segatella copri]MCP9457199.1 cytochrome c biogenesis protein CcsA [Segatella copri]MCP9502145.1 cytochrome c biogenesis protein CcsA [Segatella copri]MCP9505030.1 cytochrome c biogenesis protein CcsA [Segatella copri]MCP9508127.1 cytochrome c biogenesis protein CcsA [Segatella copri]
MVKKIIFILYILVLVCMAAATIVEKSQGTDYAHTHYYGAWWFILIWAVLAALGAFYIIKRKVKCASTLALHLSFIIILAGALLTHISAKRGMIHLRIGQPTDTYMAQDEEQGMKEEKLPFSLCLQKFEAKMHDGTNAVADYSSKFTVIDGDDKSEGEVSMNNIYSHRSYRLYQSSYDEDGKGSVLAINADPYGIPVTYTGYALLFISLVWMLFDPKGGYRKLLKSPLLKKGALMTALILSMGNIQTLHAESATGNLQNAVLPKETAEKFGELHILYNDRICPVQTFALDFCKKIYGARSYQGLTAEQVLSGWVFYGNTWANEPFIKIKSGEMKTAMNLPDYASLNTFFNREMGGYTIGQYVQEYYNGQQDKFHQQAADIDGKIQIIMELREGISLKVLPYTFTKNVKATKDHSFIKAGTTTWFSPVDKLPQAVEHQHALYIRNVFSLLNGDVKAGNTSRVNEFFVKMKKYQEVSSGNSLPTNTQYKAERINNAFPFATILFMANLTLGFIALFYTIYRMTKKREVKVLDIALPILLVVSFLALTFGLVLRWIISGNVPMSNGYESMLTVAWFVMLIAIFMQFRIRLVMVFGFLLSGFFLLVSHINQMDPAIGQMMPVLNSPLLSMHVSIIMMSYALLSLTFICGIMGICMRSHGEELQALSRVFLYPALTCMGFGIFIGAIWANVSWGNYWSWDSKETWALITFMIYAVVVHTQSLPVFRKPLVYHIYITLAFLSIAMTYFGVNYFLTGMHSYA